MLCARYNVEASHDDGLVDKLNSWCLKARLGGAFHAGIEVDGLEWSFGYSDKGTGVFAVEPQMVCACRAAKHTDARMRAYTPRTS